jgi:hypothetical protein
MQITQRCAKMRTLPRYTYDVELAMCCLPMMESGTSPSPVGCAFASMAATMLTMTFVTPSIWADSNADQCLSTNISRSRKQTELLLSS